MDNIKSKILQEIMDLMDSKMVDELKGKNPRFAKVDIQSDDPHLAEELKDKLIGENEEPKVEDMHPDMEADEDMQRLRDLYEKLK